MASKSRLEVEGEEWEQISEEIRRRIVPSDKRIRLVPEDPVEVQQRLLRERVKAHLDEQFARYVLTLRGSKGLHRADALARARKYIREYPGLDQYDSPLDWAISSDTTALLEELMNGRDHEGQEYKNGASFDPNTVYSSQTALYHSVSQHKIHNTLLLLDRGADPNIYSVYENSNEDDPWQTPLHCAARGCISTV